MPPHLINSGKGWVTAEYGMLPRATHTRSQREAAKGKQGGRTMEIQRLIGRALRSAVDLSAIGPRTFTIDCDVIQADGGTRTASITGGYVALALALRKLQKPPKPRAVAAVSVGLIGGEARLDLDYSEDSAAGVDFNLVADEKAQLIEVQGTGRGGDLLARPARRAGRPRLVRDRRASQEAARGTPRLARKRTRFINAAHPGDSERGQAAGARGADRGPAVADCRALAGAKRQRRSGRGSRRHLRPERLAQGRLGCAAHGPRRGRWPTIRGSASTRSAERPAFTAPAGRAAETRPTTPCCWRSSPGFRRPSAGPITAALWRFAIRAGKPCWSRPTSKAASSTRRAAGRASAMIRSSRFRAGASPSRRSISPGRKPSRTGRSRSGRSCRCSVSWRGTAEKWPRWKPGSGIGCARALGGPRCCSGCALSASPCPGSATSMVSGTPTSTSTFRSRPTPTTPAMSRRPTTAAPSSRNRRSSSGWRGSARPCSGGPVPRRDSPARSRRRCWWRPAPCSRPRSAALRWPHWLGRTCWAVLGWPASIAS